jgi:hypothetical protein
MWQKEALVTLNYLEMSVSFEQCVKGGGRSFVNDRVGRLQTPTGRALNFIAFCTLSFGICLLSFALLLSWLTDVSYEVSWGTWADVDYCPKGRPLCSLSTIG